MGIITRAELKSLIDSKADYILVDVREAEELEHGMIPTAKHIPLAQIPDALEYPKMFGLSKEKKIIFHCRSGSRSATATALALEKGFQAINYEGSILDWSLIDKNVEAY